MTDASSSTKIPVKWWILTLGLPTLVWADLYTKSLIVRNMFPGQRISVIENFFDIFYARNRGAAFGLFHDLSPDTGKIFFIGVALIALGILGFLFFNIRERPAFLGTTVTLILSGAIGNFADRARFGYVVDFLDFYVGEHHWPTFNVADICISIGACLLLYYSAFLEPKDQARKEATTAPAGAAVGEGGNQ